MREPLDVPHLASMMWPAVCNCRSYDWPHRRGLGRCRALPPRDEKPCRRPITDQPRVEE